MCEVTPEARTSMLGSRKAPALARRFVSRRLCPEHGDGAANAVMLVTSELVTSAVLDRSQRLELRLACEVETIEVTVTGVHPTGDDPARFREGVGMLLVAKISRDWGVRVTADGPVLWCSVPTRAAPEERAPGGVLPGPG